MKTPAQLEEALWVLGAQAGDREAFGRLASRWQPCLRRQALAALGRGDLAEDAVQETWVSVVRGLGRLRDPGAFGGWARRILARRCADRLRRRAPEEPLEVEPAAEEPGPAEVVASAEALDRALAALPPDRRALLALHHGEGLGIAELAALLGIPAGTVKSRLHHARRLVRQALEDDHG